MQESKLNEAAQRLVQNEILTCQSMLVDDLLAKGVFNYEDIEPSYEIQAEMPDGRESPTDRDEAVGEAEEHITELSDKISEIEEAIDELDIETDEETIEKLEEEKSELESLLAEWITFQQGVERGDLDEPIEIFEWWVVTNWMARKLKQYGQPILDNGYDTWWGRTCTGQAIYMDYVIQCIAKDCYMSEEDKKELENETTTL